MTYNEFIATGVAMIIAGLALLWRSEELTGRRFLGELCLLGGCGLIVSLHGFLALAYFGLP
jgi:hypothetical protein